MSDQHYVIHPDGISYCNYKKCSAEHYNEREINMLLENQRKAHFEYFHTKNDRRPIHNPHVQISTAPQLPRSQGVRPTAARSGQVHTHTLPNPEKKDGKPLSSYVTPHSFSTAKCRVPDCKYMVICEICNMHISQHAEGENSDKYIKIKIGEERKDELNFKFSGDESFKNTT
jgi:hypothetical protein